MQSIIQKSKQGGKNRISYGQKSTGNASSEKYSRPNTVEIFRHGDCFYAVRQPIFRLADERQIGYEFLSRSSVTDFEMPDDFFRLCLEANILNLVDHHCFKTCVGASIPLPQETRRHLNVFPSTLITMPVEHLINLFPSSRDEKSYCIEISEQQIIGDPSYLAKPVNEFQKAGILIAIDDVGFGRSCLESLILLQPDIIKIDKKWVNGVSKNQPREESLKRLLKVVESLGAEAVAEGIETKEDLDLLKSVGVKYGQGFLLGKPAPCPAC